MPLPTEVASGLADRGIAYRPDEPLQKKTWWRVGGPADAYVEVSDGAALASVLAVAYPTDTPVFVLGNASNLLVSDKGIPGIVIRLVGEFTVSEEEPGRLIRLGAGLKLTTFMKRAERAGWTGLELFAGIPGTVGGAVRMNAGTALGCVQDRLFDLAVQLPDGAVRKLTKPELNLSYRHCELPPGAIVTWARFELTATDPEESRKAVEEHLAYRARTQPVDVPTCGSTFRNPPGGHAGRLIEQCGLKGRQMGGAVVSQKHANFLVNTGTATAADLRRLIETIQETVELRTGIRLEPEVHFAGDWTDWNPPH